MTGLSVLALLAGLACVPVCDPDSRRWLSGLMKARRERRLERRFVPYGVGSTPLRASELTAMVNASKARGARGRLQPGVHYTDAPPPRKETHSVDAFIHLNAKLRDRLAPRGGIGLD